MKATTYNCGEAITGTRDAGWRPQGCDWDAAPVVPCKMSKRNDRAVLAALMIYHADMTGKDVRTLRYRFCNTDKSILEVC